MSSSSSSSSSSDDIDKLLSTQDIFDTQEDKNAYNSIHRYYNPDVQELIRHWRNEKVRVTIGRQKKKSEHQKAAYSLSV